MLEVDIIKRIGDFHLEVAFRVRNEILVLFGASGVGKTTTLQCIAGLQTPDSGVIRLNGETLFEADGKRVRRNIPAHKRRIAYVFQEYALFPHLTVAQNITYGVRHSAEVPYAVEAMLKQMRLEGLGDRYPDQLSGGQQQRVAVARALMIEPRCLLMDEPFSALDGAVRERLQEDIRQLQQQLYLPLLYVTHNLEDAFALGHRLAIYHNGKLEQVGETEEVFRHPWTSNVARVLGTTNIFQGEVVGATPEVLQVVWRGVRLNAPPQQRACGEHVILYIRPEDVRILYPDRPFAEAVRYNRLTGRVVRKIPRGAMNTLFFKADDLTDERDYDLEIHYPARAYQSLNLDVGVTVMVSLPKEAIHILPSQTEVREAEVSEEMKSEGNGVVLPSPAKNNSAPALSDGIGRVRALGTELWQRLERLLKLPGR